MCVCSRVCVCGSVNGNSVGTESTALGDCPYLPTPPLGKDTTQGQFKSGV